MSHIRKLQNTLRKKIYLVLREDGITIPHAQGDECNAYIDVMAEALSIYFTRMQTDGPLSDYWCYNKQSIFSLVWLKVQRIKHQLHKDSELSSLHEHVRDLINYAAFLEVENSKYAKDMHNVPQEKEAE